MWNGPWRVSQHILSYAISFHFGLKFQEVIRGAVIWKRCLQHLAAKKKKYSLRGESA